MRLEEAILNLEDGLHWMENNDVPEIFERIRFKEGLRVVLFSSRAKQEEKKGEPRYADRVRLLNDAYTGRLLTTCSHCWGKVGSRDRFCKHCGREFRESPVDAKKR